jgi:hypothetical protein
MDGQYVVKVQALQRCDDDGCWKPMHVDGMDPSCGVLGLLVAWGDLHSHGDANVGAHVGGP